MCLLSRPGKMQEFRPAFPRNVTIHRAHGMRDEVHAFGRWISSWAVEYCLNFLFTRNALQLTNVSDIYVSGETKIPNSLSEAFATVRACLSGSEIDIVRHGMLYSTANTHVHLSPIGERDAVLCSIILTDTRWERQSTGMWPIGSLALLCGIFRLCTMVQYHDVVSATRTSLLFHHTPVHMLYNPRDTTWSWHACSVSVQVLVRSRAWTQFFNGRWALYTRNYIYYPFCHSVLVARFPHQHI